MEIALFRLLTAAIALTLLMLLWILSFFVLPKQWLESCDS